MSIKVVNEKKTIMEVEVLELKLETPGDQSMVEFAEWVGYNYPGYKSLSSKVDEATLEQDIVEIKLVLEKRTDIK